MHRSHMAIAGCIGGAIAIASATLAACGGGGDAAPIAASAGAGGHGSSSSSASGGGGSIAHLPPRALLLDEQLRHGSSWIDLTDALRAAGLEVDHRRLYPHFTEADVAAQSDAGAGSPHYELVILAASDSPGTPASVLRLADIENAKSYVGAGGVLVLVPQASQSDSHSGENDWVLQNRLLEELGVAIRIDKDTVIGDAWTGDPNPPHVGSAWAYAPTLEMELGYPYLETTPGHATAAHAAKIAGGSVPTLEIGSAGVQVLLRTYAHGYLWQSSQVVDPLTKARAVAAIAPSGSGFIGVIGRGTITSLGAESGSSSDKPALDSPTLDANRAFLNDFAVYLRDLAEGTVAFAVDGPLGGDALFSAAAANLPALGSGKIIKMTSNVSMRPVAAAAPAGDLLELTPTLASPKTTPAWFGKGGGRIAYGDLTKDFTAMTAAFAETEMHGIDALLSTTSPERLTDPSTEATWHMIHTQIAALATAAGARWIVGGYYTGTIWGESPGKYPEMVGSDGVTADAPDPVDPTFWDDVMIPTYAAVGALAKDNPGIFGLSFDFEQYQGPTWHSDGYAFSKASLAAFASAAAPGVDVAAISALAPAARLDALVDQGLLKPYFAALEQASFELGVKCREAATANAPDLTLVAYIPVFPSSWFYHGLLRGLGTADHPVVVLSFESWADRATEVLRAEGVHLVHVGGTLTGNWNPGDFGSALSSLAARSEGYWYLSFNDFSATNAMPPALHGAGTAYWAAVDAANMTLAAAK